METSAPNDTVKTIGEGGRRVWLYPTWFRGRWLTRRTWVHAALVALLLVGPWIDIGGHPAMHIDIVGRRAYVWGLQFFATDGSYLLFLFGALVFAVFLFTALFGRAWCGWACPQTVFLETVIRPIERAIEGGPNQRKKLDQAPWTARKVAIKASKWSIFGLVCGAIGTTFTAYFLGRDGVIEAQLDPLAHPAGTATFLFITGITFFDFFWFREQTCLVVCPYGRLQSVLLDADSLLVAYDAKRGEPRGPLRRVSLPVLATGDCVDCRRCVQVCPTGTDIRKGATMECVQCMACIDACDDVMSKLGRPQGLVRLSSENAIGGRSRRSLRPRVIAYAVGLVGVFGVAAVAVSHRQPVELAVSRTVGLPYVSLPDGSVQNPIRLRIANKSDEARSFVVEPIAPAELTVVVPVSPWTVGPGRVDHTPVLLTLPGTAPAERVEVRVRDDAGFEQTVEVEFLAGGPR